MIKQEIAEEIQKELEVFKSNSVSIEALIKSVKASLSKLTKVKDETVTSVVGELSGYVDELDLINKGQKVEDPKTVDLKPTTKKEDEPVVENKDDTEVPVVEDKEGDIVTDETPEVIPEVTPEVTKDDDPKDLSAVLPAADNISIELSQKVAGKLEESALELSKLEGEVNAKTEIIDGYKNKVLELQKELNNYKAKEEEQIALRFKSKATKLIELYAKLGIAKGYGEIELNFSENQVDKLISDLSVMQPSTAKPVVKRDMATVELSKQTNTKKEVSADEKARLLFNFS